MTYEPKASITGIAALDAVAVEIPLVCAPIPAPVARKGNYIIAGAGSEFVAPDDFTAWRYTDAATLRRARFVYGDFYAAGYTSLTIAPPKVGKSLLTVAEAIDAASGCAIIRDEYAKPCKVLYYCAEDDLDTIKARILATVKEHGIDQELLVGNLFPVSGISRDAFFLAEGDTATINEPLFAWLEAFIRQHGISLVIFDPLQDMTRCPETNDVFRRIGQRLRALASATGVAIGLIHHTRKMAPGVKATIDDARGGSALRGSSRFNRILVPMTEEEAASAGVEDHRNYFRIGETESNLAPPSSSLNQWFEKVGVCIADGHYAPAVRKWVWPDAFAGLPTGADRIAHRLTRDAEENGSPLRANIQAREWAGHSIGKALRIDTSEKRGKGKMKAILNSWIAKGVLRIEQSPKDAKGNSHPVLVAGEVDTSEADV